MSNQTDNPIQNIRISVFDYTKYSVYLKDFFDNKKVQGKKYSYQFLATKWGLKHKSSVSSIINGTRKNIPKALVKKISEFLELSAREEEYFTALIAFNESSTIDDKNHYYSRMHKVIRPGQHFQLQKSQFGYFKNWYIPVIRELITMDSFDGNLKTIKAKLQTNIKLEQVEEAVQILEDLKLIKKQGKKYVQSNASLSLDEEMRSFALQQFYIEHFDIMKDILFKQSIKHKSKITSLTFGCNAEQIALLKQKISEFHQTMIDMISDFGEIDQVYQMNLQLYPTSK